jgi:NADH:ubiquinone oxidoreductase subunit F (NADH-binding)/NADH:ubiquinone oxidoreductase subunit E/NAD-dependent dihydropyrimidine dehydrogenase PreA subunit
VNEIGNEKHNLIAVLQALQQKYKYLPKEVLKILSEISESTPAQINGVVSFYSQFRTEEIGENLIKVCDGTACHIKGSDLIHKAFHRILTIAAGKDTDPSKKYTVEKVACLGCCTIAPVVQINNTTYGHISSDKVDLILQDFENQKDKNKTIFKDNNGNEIDGEIRIGLGSCCVASGSLDIKNELDQSISKSKLNIDIKSVGCVGMCHQVPMVEIIPKNKSPKIYSKVQPEEIESILNKHFKSTNIFHRFNNNLIKNLKSVQDDSSWDGVERFELDLREKHISQFLNKQYPIATLNRGVLNPLDIEEYISLGGFEALKKAIKMTPDDVLNEIRNSQIRGRGGAGFHSWKKCKIVKDSESSEKYLICNGDEGDPGAFMDRMILESYPFRVIEGMLIAAYTCGISKAFFYIRDEYKLAVERIHYAIDICKDSNLIGNNILESGFSIDFKIEKGAGAFVCGEETALIESIHGKRGNPFFRPPYPAEKGLFNKPTLINNTETFAQISFIIKNGADKFSQIGIENNKGSKVFALAGKIKNGGLIEVPLGISIREVVENIGGGIANNKKFKAVQTGGPSGGCIPESLADMPMEFDSLKDLNSMMGSGGLIVLDEDDCMVEMARYFLSFTQSESCGKCTFCRLGTKRMLDILDDLCSGNANESDIDELEKLCLQVKKGSLCGLGKSAPNPVLTGLKYFRDEYIAHTKKICPAGKCEDLISYTVNDFCIGCTICAQNCPSDAIEFKPYEKHFINQELCIKCDNCYQLCPENAISVE